MKSDKTWLRVANQCCAEIGPEDGIDPRHLSKQHKDSKRRHKDMQLCKRAKRTADLVFAGETLNQLLRELVVDRVELSANGNQLLMTVLVEPNLPPEQTVSIADALTHVKGYVRAAVAQAIERKRVPAIRFRIAHSDNPLYYEQEV